MSDCTHNSSLATHNSTKGTQVNEHSADDYSLKHAPGCAGTWGPFCRQWYEQHNVSYYCCAMRAKGIGRQDSHHSPLAGAVPLLPGLLDPVFVHLGGLVVRRVVLQGRQGVWDESWSGACVNNYCGGSDVGYRGVQFAHCTFDFAMVACSFPTARRRGGRGLVPCL
jgi:hypothetical protein